MNALTRRALFLRGARQRHPVAAVLGEQRQPFVETLLVDQARLERDEVLR